MARKTNIRRISYLKLRMFCEAYHCKSYTKTAENLSTSQTVITRAIDDIEEMLGGVTLFEKISNVMHPTKHAHSLYEKIQPSLMAINDAFCVEDSQSLSIAATHAVCCTILPIVLGQSQFKNNDAKYDIFNTDRDNAISLIRRDIVDVAFFPTSEMPSDIAVLDTIDFEPAILVHKDNPLVHNKNITQEDIFAENLIMIDDFKISENYRTLFQSIYDKQRIKINNADYEMIIKFVARGHGSCLFADIPIDIKNVVSINLSGKLPPLRYIAIARQSYTAREMEFVREVKKLSLSRDSFTS